MEFIHHFMNSSGNINEDLWALFVNCQILSMLKLFILIPMLLGGHHGFTTTYAISAYHH
jgi:hypothetical protein